MIEVAYSRVKKRKAAKYVERKYKPESRRLLWEQGADIYAMRIKGLAVALCLALGMTAGEVPALAAGETPPPPYQVDSPNKASNQLYKGMPVDWYLTYALKEFDAYAVPPGSNWTWGTSNKKFGPPEEKWVSAAKDKGWATSTDIKDAEVGALLIVSDSYGDSRAIITEVHAAGIGYKMPNVEGIPSKFWLAFADAGARGFNLSGIIFPRPANSPVPALRAADLPGTGGPGEDYKGIAVKSPLATIARQFDQTVPVAVPWKDNSRYWPEQAGVAGLKVSTDIMAAKPGSLLITGREKTVAALVKAVYPDRLVVEEITGSEVYFRQRVLSEIKDFVAYIYPERQQP